MSCGEGVHREVAPRRREVGRSGCYSYSKLRSRKLDVGQYPGYHNQVCSKAFRGFTVEVSRMGLRKTIFRVHFRGTTNGFV